MINTAELSTASTDYALGALAAWGAYRLMRLARAQRRRSVAWWSAGFAVLAVSAVAGGTYHGVVWSANDLWQTVLWKLTVFGIGAFNGSVLAGSAVACLGGRARLVFGVVNAAIFIVYAGWMLTHDDYRFVIYYSSAAMVGILLMHWVYARRASSTRWMGAAVAVSALAALIQQSGVALHERFNHNDLYHVIQIVGLYLFYSGASLLSDASVSARRSGRQ